MNQPSYDHRRLSGGRPSRGASTFSRRFLWIPLATLLVAAWLFFVDGSSTNVASQRVDDQVSGKTDFILPRSGLLAEDSQASEMSRLELRSLLSVEQAGGRVLTTFLDRRPVATVMLTAATPRQPGLPFAERPKSEVHEVPDFDNMKDDEIALCCEGAYAMLLHARGLPPGETRVDMVPARRLRVQLVNVPSGLMDAVTLDAQISFAFDRSRTERFACTAMSAGVLPMAFSGDSCEAPLFLERDGEVTVCAKPRTGGPGYTVRQSFVAADGSVTIDLSSLEFCRALAELEVTLGFPYAEPTGELRLALIDAAGCSLATRPIVRRSEPTLAAVFRGIRPGRYRLLLWRADHLSTGLGDVEISSGRLSVHRQVIAQSVVEVLVQSSGERDLDSCRIVAWDSSGTPLGDPGRRGDRAGVFRMPSLQAGRYFVQARAEAAQAASRVACILVREAETQQLSLTLAPAGELRITRTAETPLLELAAGADPPSRLFLHRQETSFWFPAGSYAARTGKTEFALDIVPGAVATVDLR